MKRETDRDARSSICHWLTFISFGILFTAVAFLSLNVYNLRREIDKVKSEIRPSVLRNDKGESRLYDDYIVRSRFVRQIEPGPDEIEPGPGEGNPSQDAGPELHQNSFAKLNCTRVSITKKGPYSLVSLIIERESDICVYLRRLTVKIFKLNMSLPQLNQPFHFVANVVVCMSYLRLPDILPKFAASLLLCVSSRLLELSQSGQYPLFLTGLPVRRRE